MQIIFDIMPIPKPRMTRSDAWKKRPCVLAYWKYKDALQAIAIKNKFELPASFEIDFVIPMPDSWSKAKKSKMLHKPHQQKPDLDNLVKAINDCLSNEDAYIHTIHAKKVWGVKGRIFIIY